MIFLYTEYQFAVKHKKYLRVFRTVFDFGNKMIMPIEMMHVSQGCNGDSSKIFGKGRLYWFHDFVATSG